MRCDALRKRLREPKSVVAAGRLFHDFTTGKPEQQLFTMRSGVLTINVVGYANISIVSMYDIILHYVSL